MRMRVLYLRRLRSTTLIPPNVRFETRDQTIPPNFDEVSEKGKNCALDKHFLKKNKFSRKKAFISYRVFVASRIIDCVFSTFRHFNLL